MAAPGAARNALTIAGRGTLLSRLQVHEDLLELDPRAVLGDDLADLSALVCLHLVHQLHRLDDRNGLACVDDIACLHERRRARLRRAVEGSDERRLDRMATVQ